MDFPRLLRQVMTWFIEDLQSRAWLDRRGEVGDSFWLHAKDGKKLSLLKNSPLPLYSTHTILTSLEDMLYLCQVIGKQKWADLEDSLISEGVSHCVNTR